jgi:zinc and cadmium transporter
MLPFLYSLIAAIAVSLISLIGVFLIFIKTPALKKTTLFLVSFAVGGLLGDALIHLLPESFKVLNHNFLVSILTISGILLFFLIEKFLRWRHCHDLDCVEESRMSHLSVLNLIGDSVHNFFDGMVIAASFLVSIPLGVTTTLAVTLHEIPQEIGDFGIFVHNGLSVSKALFFNFISAFSSLLGVLLTFVLGGYLAGFSTYFIPITAGGFIYLAASDLIPELHRHDQSAKQSAWQLFFIVLGVVLMSLLVFIE